MASVVTASNVRSALPAAPFASPCRTAQLPSAGHDLLESSSSLLVEVPLDPLDPPRAFEPPEPPRALEPPEPPEPADPPEPPDLSALGPDDGTSTRLFQSPYPSAPAPGEHEDEE